METNKRFRHARNCGGRFDHDCTCEVEDRYYEWAEGQADDHTNRIEWEGEGR